ncbi:MAG: NAD(P)/FAD-dependent oxidoreductase [Elusimicrobia bacterium]|nr:NAD(P)/FAD-dependent oxidoreductase [Elusimicrobiota bacterium]
MKSSGKIVIIGSSVAAISAIETIREKNKNLPITVITKDRDLFYSRPLISYTNFTDEQRYYRDKNFFRKNNVDLIFGEATIVKNNSVVLENKKNVKFSELLIAVGGKPITLDIKGIDGKNVFTLTTKDDADNIKKFCKNKKHAVVIGCGMIGIKAAEFLKGLGLNVSIVELMDKPFASVLDEKSGKIIADKIKKHAKLILNNSVSDIKENQCILKNGEKIPSDIVICAIGVVPNLDIAKKSQIKTNRGIVVDEFMRTSRKNVYAAGDCTEALDILSGKKIPIPIWPVAYRQGAVAGSNIAGIAKEYAGGFVRNSVDVFGLPLITLGLSNDKSGEEIVFSDEKSKVYKKAIVKDGKIIGAIFVGDIARAGIFTGMIKDGIDVSNFKNEIFSENFGYIYVPKEFRSKEVTPIEI